VSADPHALPRFRRWSPWATAGAIALAHAWVALVLLDPAVLLSVDAAVKLLQAQALLASNWTSVALPYPGAAIDPGGEFFPFLPPFAFRAGSEWQGIFPTSVAMLNALALRAGIQGVVGLSVVGALVAMVAAAHLSTGRTRWAIPLVLGTATPFWFYAVLPWEHAPAAGLSTAAVAIAARDASPTRLRWAGVILGFAIALRDESVLLVPVLLWAGLGRRARPATVVALLALCALPSIGVGLLDGVVYARPVAAHVRHAADPLHWVGLAAAPDLPRRPPLPLAERYDIVMHEWLLGYRGHVQSLLFLGLVAAVALGRRSELRVWGVLVVLCLVLGRHFKDLQVLLPNPDFATGLLRLAPVLIFAALPLAEHDAVGRPRFDVLCSAAIFVAGMIVLTSTTGGASLGPRLLVPILPLLAAAAWDGLDSYRQARQKRLEYRVIWLVGLALLAGSILMQVAVAAPAYIAFNTSERQPVRWLEEASGPVIVDSTFTASVAHPVYATRAVLLAASQPSAAAVASRLAARGDGDLLVVSREQHQVLQFPPFRLADTRRTAHTVVQHWMR
jgi:hypothetical protein